MIQYLDNQILCYHSVIICSRLQENMKTVRNCFKERLLDVDFDFFLFFILIFFYIFRASESTVDWLKRRLFD